MLNLVWERAIASMFTQPRSFITIPFLFSAPPYQSLVPIIVCMTTQLFFLISDTLTHTLVVLGYEAAQNLSAQGGVGGRTAKTKQEQDECGVVCKYAVVYMVSTVAHQLSNLLALSFVLPVSIHQLSVMVTSA